jgi:hypothetical protein
MASRSKSATPNRTTAPSTPAPAATKPDADGALCHEKVAMRAYEKWCKRGRPCGTEMQDWLEAESELRAEMAKTCQARK